MDSKERERYLRRKHETKDPYDVYVKSCALEAPTEYIDNSVDYLSVRNIKYGYRQTYG